jgi:hypothetical protein
VSGNALSGELDEARLLLDTAERSRRHAENEVGEIREAMNELTRSEDKKENCFCCILNFMCVTIHASKKGTML